MQNMFKTVEERVLCLIVLIINKKGSILLAIYICNTTWIMVHSVLEWIWIKGSYLSQWLPQGESGPPKESKSRWIEILKGGSHVPLTKFFSKVFFRLTIFFQEQKFFFQGTTFLQFFMYCKAKKNFAVIRKILKNFDFQKS